MLVVHRHWALALVHIRKSPLPWETRSAQQDRKDSGAHDFVRPLDQRKPEYKL